MKRLISFVLAALRAHDQLTAAGAWAVVVGLVLPMTFFAIPNLPLLRGNRSPRAAQDGRPMDLVWGTSTDLNGAPLVPHWRSQERDAAV